MKTKNVKSIHVDDFDDLVQKTYNKVFNFQQQDGCKERGTFEFTVPCKAEDYENDTIHDDEKMGVSFEAWLKRDPSEPIGKHCLKGTEQWVIDLWWQRNFYPHVSMIINDLHSKELIESGNYIIDIDW